MSERMKLTHIVTHPTRARLMEELGKGRNYAESLSRALGLNPRLIRFHLSVLHRNGLIDGKFDLTQTSSNPYAAKFWSLTKEGEEMLGLLEGIRSSP